MMQNQPVNPGERFEVDAVTKLSIVRAVEAAKPIEDLLGWLIAKYPDADREWVFAALKAIYASDFAIAPASQEAKTYRIGREEISACPQRVT